MHRNFFSSLAGKSILTLTASSLAVLTLAGCGMGTAAVTAPQSVVLPAMSGKVMGGETAVVGANVILWETDPANSGYGVATNGSSTGAQQLATAITGTGGGFSFTAGSYTCAPGQFAYLTATGGDASGGLGTENNSNLVLVAAIGSCSNFSSTAAENNIEIVINELSTVAAAYTLGSFMTVNDNGNLGSQLVYIGAPANNNVAAGSGACSGTGASMSCQASGLANAFANAYKLVDAVHFDGSIPSGMARTVDPNNSLGSVPQAVINSLGDIMSYCTESASSGTGGTNCAVYFGDATPVNSTTAPTDTLSAMVNIARQPYNKVGNGTCTGSSGGLFCLISGTPPWTALATAPSHDWSIAIAYTGVPNQTTTSFGDPQSLILDAADNVYVMTGNTYSATAVGIAAMTNAGVGKWNTAPSANICTYGMMSPDNVGNIWTTVYQTTGAGCAYGIYEWSASSGAQENFFEPGSSTVCGQASPTSSNCPGFVAYDTTHSIQSTPRAIGFDRFNNLWYARGSSSCANCIFELPYSTTSYSSTGNYGAPINIQNSFDSSNKLIIDSNDNVWVNAYSSTSGTGGQLAMIPNTGTTSAPAYAGGPDTANKDYVSTTLTTYDDGDISLDALGNIWSASQDNTYEFTPTVNGTSSTFGTATTITNTDSHPNLGEVDGGATYWFGNWTNSGSINLQITPAGALYNSTTPSTNLYIRPCYVPAGGTTCNSTLLIGSPTATQYYVTGDPRNVQVDSAGAIWVAAGGDATFTTGFVVQILGAGSPTWPLLNYGVFGTKPH